MEEVELAGNCTATCDAVSNLVEECGWYDNGNRGLTNGIYFILRTLATMALACCFIMLDAQTIQMCKVTFDDLLSVTKCSDGGGRWQEGLLWSPDSLQDPRPGEQTAVSCHYTNLQAVISPLVGLLMDKVTKMTGYANYTAPFMVGELSQSIKILAQETACSPSPSSVCSPWRATLG